MLKQIKLGVQNGPITKNGDLSNQVLYFLENVISV